MKSTMLDQYAVHLGISSPPAETFGANNLLLDDAPFGVALLDPSLKYVYINKYLAKVNGIEVEDHVGEYIYDILPQHSDAIIPILQSVFASGVPVTFELRQVPSRADRNALKDWLTCCYPARDVDNKIRGVAVTVSDVTETNETERRLQLLSDNMLDIVTLHRPDGTIIYASSSSELQLGYSPDELVGMNAYELIHPEDRARVRKHFDALRGEIRRTTYRIITKDGITKYFEALSSPVKDLDGNITNIQVSSRDVTEQILTKAALKDSEARLRVTIEEMSEGLIVRAADGTIMLTNDAAVKIIGLSKETIDQSKGWYENYNFFHEDGSPCKKEEYPFYACMRTGRRQRNVVLGTVQPNDEISWISVNSSPLFRDGETTPYAVVSTIRDITDEKRLEKAKQDRRTAAQMQLLSVRLIEAQESERRKIAADLHDELGGALTGLKLLLENLKRSSGTSVAPKLEQATSLVQEIIADVREMSMDLRPAILDHSGLIPALRWYFKRYTSQTGIRINFRSARLVPHVNSKIEVTLFRIVQEALTNIARHAEVDRAVVSITKSNGTIKVSIRDQGKGFDSELAHQKMDSAGLAGISERLRLIGGNFQLTTSPGKGTRITAELPIGTELE